MTEQTVIDDTKPGSMTSGAATDAQEKTLQQLLAEYAEPEGGGGDNGGTGNGAADLSPADAKRLLSELEAEKERRVRQDSERAVAEVGAAARQHFKAEGLDIADDVASQLMYGFVSMNPKVLQAFLNRGKDPKTLDSFIKARTKEIVQALKNVPDATANADRIALGNAIKQRAQTVDDNEYSMGKLGGMSNHEFEKLKRAMG